MMPEKWRYLIVGVLSGVFLSSLIFILIFRHPSSPALTPFVTSTVGPIQEANMLLPNIPCKIDLNNTTVEELSSLPSIGEIKAKAILEFRMKYGDFQAVEELLYVPGIGESVLKTIQDDLCVTR